MFYGRSGARWDVLLPGLWSLSTILLYVSVVLCTALHHSTSMGVSYLLYRHHQSCHVLVQPHETLSALDSEFHSANWTVRSTQMCFVFRLFCFIVFILNLYSAVPDIYFSTWIINLCCSMRDLLVVAYGTWFPDQGSKLSTLPWE